MIKILIDNDCLRVTYNLLNENNSSYESKVRISVFVFVFFKCIDLQKNLNIV